MRRLPVYSVSGEVQMKFQVGDQVTVLSGPFAGFEGKVVATPSLGTFYTYTLSIEARIVRGLKANQLQYPSSKEPQVYSTRPAEADEEIEVSPLGLFANEVELCAEALQAPVETEPFHGEGGQFGGGGASESFDAPESPSFDSDSSGGDSDGSDFGGSDFGGDGSDF